MTHERIQHQTQQIFRRYGRFGIDDHGNGGGARFDVLVVSPAENMVTITVPDCGIQIKNHCNVDLKIMKDEQKTCWSDLIRAAMDLCNDSELIAGTLSDKELDEEFDAGYGFTEGKPFTAWSATHVYFPANYDGKEWVASVPRDPCGFSTPHIGGGC